MKTEIYLDIRQLYSVYVTGTCIRWWPEPTCIDPEKLTPFLHKFFTALHKNGCQKVFLSFAQLCDIEKLMHEKAGSPSDTITQIFTPADHNGPYSVGDSGPNFLHYFIDMAHRFEIQVVLSMGGAIATSDDMTLQGGSQATALASFLGRYGLDGVDFVLEGVGLAIMEINPEEELLSFFKELRGATESRLTVPGSLHDGPAGTLAPLFNNLNTIFSGVNLMLYSNTEHYLDAHNVTLGINEWLRYVPPHQMHIGFHDKITYENPAVSASENYAIPTGLTRGEAAGFVYTTVVEKAGLNLDQMGTPFWWIDIPQTLATNRVIEDFSKYFALVPSD